MDRLNTSLGKWFNIYLGKWFGIPVSLHWSWVIMEILFSLISPITFFYVIAVFFFVLLHELGHCLSAKKFNITVQSIVLYPIGGLARLDGSFFRNAKIEFIVAIAGPLVNLFFCPILLSLGVWTENSFLITMGVINLVLFVFNLLPAFPMDGGRMFRAALNWYWGDFLKATKIAVLISKFCCIFMAIAGFLIPNIILVFIALFMWFGGDQELLMAQQLMVGANPGPATSYSEFQRLIREVDDIRR